MKTTSFSIHDLLTLQIVSGRDSAHRFFDTELAYFGPPPLGRADVQVTVGPPPEHQDTVFFLDNCKYTVSDNAISFSEWYKIFRLRLGITDLQGPETKLYFDGLSLTYRLLLLKFVIPLMRLRLLQQGLTVVKASAIENEDGVWLLPAWSGGGKSSLVLHALERGFNFWSDTFSLVSQEGKVYPFPRPLHLFWRNVATCPSLWARISRKERACFRLKQGLHALSLHTLNLSHRLAIGEIAKGQPPRRLHAVSLLTWTSEPVWRGERGLPIMQMLPKIVANDRHETRLFDAAYHAYVQRQSSPWDYWRVHVQVLESALENALCNHIFLPHRPESQDFERILDWQMA